MDIKNCVICGKSLTLGGVVCSEECDNQLTTNAYFGYQQAQL